MTAQHLENMDASDDPVLGTGNPSNNSTSVDAETSHSQLLCPRALPAALNPPRMMTSTSLQPPTRMARSLNPLITKDLVLKFSGVLPPLGKPRCLRYDRRSLYDSADDAGSSASAVKSKRHKHGAPSSPDIHRKPKKHKQHKKHKKPHSKAFYAHSDPVSSSSTSDATPLSSSPAPSSSPVAAAFTANSGARSPPAPLPAALAVRVANPSL
ncbi:hypothetical protein PC128_g16388 [Phytophthora cactorum]|nr:hypothetical protein PC128_g16388 [Phytophthora cactorum]